MSEYAHLFQSVQALAAAWASGDMDAHIAQGDAMSRLTSDEVAEFVEDFCTRAGVHVDELGADAVGDLIWYLMGAGEQIWHRIAEASPEYAEDAVLSLRHLYEGCFARHLNAWDGAGLAEGRLASACYMLWDMGGGLEGIPIFQVPKALVPACYTVLEHALSLESPACWESALHGLGHIVFSKPGQAQELIDEFLTAKRERVPEDLRSYARAARDGGVQ